MGEGNCRWGERSIELEPNGALYHGFFGVTLCTAGKIDEGIAQLNQGIRLNPFPAWWYFLNLGGCYVQKGLGAYYRFLAARGKSPRENLKKAVELAQKALSLGRIDGRPLLKTSIRFLP